MAVNTNIAKFWNAWMHAQECSRLQRIINGFNQIAAFTAQHLKRRRRHIEKRVHIGEAQTADGASHVGKIVSKRNGNSFTLIADDHIDTVENGGKKGLMTLVVALA